MHIVRRLTALRCIINCPTYGLGGDRERTSAVLFNGVLGVW